MDPHYEADRPGWQVEHVAMTPNGTLPIVPTGASRWETQRDGRRVAVFDHYADAALFLAAPALLAACEAALEYLTTDDGPCYLPDVLNGLIAAVAAAKGERNPHA